MRIRQIKPSFFTDPTLAHVTVGARLMYVGLWCAADDAGWLCWDLDELGALLFPYEPPVRRRHQVTKWSGELMAQGRVRVMDCGCAVVPTMEAHQKTSGGSRSYVNRQRHERLHRSPELSGFSGTERNVKSNGKGTVTRETDKDVEETTTSEFQRLVPLPTSIAGGKH